MTNELIINNLLSFFAMTTKEKILREATKLFNKEGFFATSLFEIAQKMGISRGNLTYHFKDKDVLLEAIAAQMWEKMEREKSKSRRLPSFENLHNEIHRYYKFQREYQFIFLDRLVLAHPALKRQFRTMTEQTLADNKASIAFAIELGNMHPESVKGLYHNISFITWMLTFFWLAQQIIRGDKTKEDGEKMIWSILIPHMTDKGIRSFKNFYGEKYYESIGQKFDIDLAQLISF